MGSLFSKPPDAPAPTPAPEIEETPAIPMKDDDKARRGRRKQAAARRNNRQGGRESTILTSGDKLG